MCKRLTLLGVFFLSGCAFVNDANRLGADLDLGIDGIIANVAGVHLKTSVAIERSKDEAKPGGAGAIDRGFL
jgi:hypothetical protein